MKIHNNVGNPVVKLVRDTWEGHDLQWEVLMPFFTVAEVMHEAGLDIPMEWQYRRGLFQNTIEDMAEGEDWLTAEVARWYLDGQVSDHQLLMAGHVLHRLHEAIPDSERY